MSRTPCPLCDLQAGNTVAVAEAFAYGAALGCCSYGNLHSITEMMCDRHRTPYVVAAAQMAIRANTVDGEPAFGEEVVR